MLSCPLKRCRTCGQEKPITAFDKGHRVTGERPSRGGYGVVAHCKFCKAERRKPGINVEREQRDHARSLLAEQGKKRCTQCLVVLPLVAFHVNRKTPDGRSFPCPECVKKRQRKWRAANPDGFKRWQEANRERRDAYNKRWRSENVGYRAVAIAEWSKANRGRVNAKNARRIAAKFRATPAWADHDAIRAIYAEAARLTRETGIRHEVDHFYPLQGELVCGLHCEANLQILTKEENIRKLNRMPEEAMAA